MKNNNRILVMAPALALGIALTIPAFALEAGAPVPAGTSMHQAGEDSEGAVKNAYTGAVTATEDTTITTRVKAAFATGKDIKSGDIHVTTTAGIVTLGGEVQNSDIAARAVTIARNTDGVRGVTNDLQISSTKN